MTISANKTSLRRVYASGSGNVLLSESWQTITSANFDLTSIKPLKHTMLEFESVNVICKKTCIVSSCGLVTPYDDINMRLDDVMACCYHATSPLPEPMLTDHHRVQFHKSYFRYYFSEISFKSPRNNELTLGWHLIKSGSSGYQFSKESQWVRRDGESNYQGADLLV